jgi:hypothetical protein
MKASLHFRGKYRLHLPGQRVNQARNQQEVGGKHSSACKIKLFSVFASFGINESHKFPFTEN